MLTYNSIKYFPKKDQYSLGIRLETMVLEILELTVLAKTKAGTSRMLLLNKIDVKLKLFKLFVRIAHDIKAMSQSRYISLEEKLLEIGRMLGGWIRKLNTKPADDTAGSS